MLEINVEEALQKTMEVARSKKEEVDKFGCYAPIYVAPTGNVIDMINLYKKGEIKKALVVGSQGSFAYELALKTNVKEIDCFDKNILQYLFFELYDTALKNCPFKDFIKGFTSEHASKVYGNIQTFNGMLNEYLLFDLLEVMGGGYAREYWSKLFKKIKNRSDLIQSNLFRLYYPIYESYLKKYSSVYIENEFRRLQKILTSKEIKINYNLCDIDSLHKVFANKKYDLIIFGNVLQYYKSIPTLDNISAIDRFVKEKWAPMLNEEGQLQLGYGFEMITGAVNQMLGRKAHNYTSFPDSLFKKRNEQYIKTECIPNLIKKYGEKYIVNFIPGVEQEDGHENVENVILTYKKNK